MAPVKSRLIALTLATLVAFSVHVVLEAVDVQVDFDKTFDFKPVRTWGWNPAGMGEVKMARTQDDDPAAMTMKVEPWIRDAVAREMTRRGLTESSTPDVTVTYFLLLTISTSAQTVGQFLPATTAWALPPFVQSTQSLKMMNKGALVLDLRARNEIVWRGVARSQIDIGVDDKKREARVREAVRDLLRRVPTK
jgi:hypothetical protein